MYICLHVKCLFVLSDQTEFFGTFCKNTKISDFIKIRAVGTDGQKGGQADRQKDMTNLTVVFRNFAKAPETCIRISLG